MGFGNTQFGATPYGDDAQVSSALSATLSSQADLGGSITIQKPLSATLMGQGTLTADSSAYSTLSCVLTTRTDVTAYILVVEPSPEKKHSRRPPEREALDISPHYTIRTKE